jgi:hypothetical protein
MAGCEGCEVMCPAMLAAAEERAVLQTGLAELDRRDAERRANREEWGNAILAAGPAALEQGYSDGEPVGDMYQAADTYGLFAGIAAQRDAEQRGRLTSQASSLERKVEARQAACDRGPQTGRRLGFIGAKQTVCGSTVTNDGLPNRRDINKS